MASTSRAPNPLKDRRYQQLIIEYRYNWTKAALALFGRNLTPQQRQMIEELQKTGCLVSIASGHGTGKSDSLAIVALLYCLMYPYSRVRFLSNKIDQTRSGLFKYLKIHWQTVCRRKPWLAQYFSMGAITFESVYGKGVWQISTVSCKPGNEEALAGEHAEHMLIVVDEASGVSDVAFKVITGALTQEDNRMCLLSQPTRNSGYFYDSHHKLALNGGKNPDGIFVNLTFSSEESPLVTTVWLKRKAAELGGVLSADYGIKVLGRFSENGDTGNVLSRGECLRGQKNNPLLNREWGWLCTVDASDGGADAATIVISRVSGMEPEERAAIPVLVKVIKGMKAITLAREVHKICDESLYPGIAIAVDGGGVGGPVYDLLVELRPHSHIQKINWGDTPFSDRDKERFINQRAAATIHCANAIRSGRLRLPMGDLVIDEGSRIPCYIDESGRYCILSKKLMRKQGIPSPNLFDALCFVFLSQFVSATRRILSVDAQRQADEADELYYGAVAPKQEDIEPDPEVVEPENEDAALWAGEGRFGDDGQAWNDDDCDQLDDEYLDALAD